MGLHADYLDFGAHLFDEHGHAGRQPAAADGHEHGINRLGMLAHDFQPDGALAGNHVGVVERRDIGLAAAFGQLYGVVVGIVERHAFEHHFAAARAHCVHFNLRRGFGHHDGGFAAELLRRKRHALGMVAGAGGDHAFLQKLGRQLGHFVVCAPDFEGENGLEVFAFEQDAVAAARGKVAGEIQRRFGGHVVNGGGEDAGEVVGVGQRHDGGV